MPEETVLYEGGDHFLRGIGNIPVLKQGSDELLKLHP